LDSRQEFALAIRLQGKLNNEFYAKLRMFLHLDHSNAHDSLQLLREITGKNGPDGMVTLWAFAVENGDTGITSALEEVYKTKLAPRSEPNFDEPETKFERGNKQIKRAYFRAYTGLPDSCLILVKILYSSGLLNMINDSIIDVKHMSSSLGIKGCSTVLSVMEKCINEHNSNPTKHMDHFEKCLDYIRENEPGLYYSIPFARFLIAIYE
jgi:hypothetical protein